MSSGEFPFLRRIASLYDYKGIWPAPYRQAGYEVFQYDLKHGCDVRLLKVIPGIHGILAAPPCTDFSVSGAQYWGEKDLDGSTLDSLALVDACYRIIMTAKLTGNLAWWVIESSTGRLPEWLGEPRMRFDPYEFGGWLNEGERSHKLAPPQDAYTKKTCLWGEFNLPEKRPVTPIRECSQGSWIQKLGGKSERTKEARSITPLGFARAFAAANP